MKRLSLKSYSKVNNSSGKVDRIDINLIGMDGQIYTWTPDWNREAKNLFMDVYQLLNPEISKASEIGKKAVPEQSRQNEEYQRNPDELKPLAIKLARALHQKISYSDIRKAAGRAFDFDCKTHGDSVMIDVRSQDIYDWIMTLSEQPLSSERKLALLREFIVELAPRGSPLASLKGIAR